MGWGHRQGLALLGTGSVISPSEDTQPGSPAPHSHSVRFPPLCLSTPPGGSVACPRSALSAGKTELFPSFLPFFSLSMKGCWCPPCGSPVQVGFRAAPGGTQHPQPPRSDLGTSCGGCQLQCSLPFPTSHHEPPCQHQWEDTLRIPHLLGHPCCLPPVFPVGRFRVQPGSAGW